MKRQTKKDKELLLLRMNDFHHAIRDYDVEKMTNEFLERCERLLNISKDGLLEQIELVRAENHSPLGMEMYFSLARFLLWNEQRKAIIDDAVRTFEAKKIRSKGGRSRAAPFDKLKEETIRLYEAGQWDSVPLAAAEITPKIVQMSKTIGGQPLFPSTGKPLAWIRAHNRNKTRQNE